MLTINLETARRFILGKQGLWPGRRWRDLKGTEQAMRAIEYLQLDPLQITARSHDIQLYGRVLNYTPGLWEDVAYQQRNFFDWGGWLATRPMDELPYWRVIMHRERDGHPDCDPRIRQMAREHADAIAEIRAILHERRIVNNRDFDMAARTRTDSYRGRKDSALALYYLWRTGEVMTHHRENFERVYALTETVAPAHLIRQSSQAGTDRFLLKKEISPEHKRKFGYYTLPILWGDQLVGRFDSKLDRPTNTLIILGFWLEDEALGQNEAFAAALARGLTRFLTFLGTNKLDAKAISQPLLRQHISSS